MAEARNGLEWFRPLWRRVLVVAFCLGWTLFEWFYSRDAFWGMLTLGLLAYAVWTFFITFDRRVGPPPDKPASP